MGSNVDISVLIATRARATKVAACLDRLLPGRQSLPPERYEVLLGVDGADDATERSLRLRLADAGKRMGRVDLNVPSHASGGFRVVRVGGSPGSESGSGAVRNELLRLATGRVIVTLNDDVLPTEGLLAAHLDEHARRESAKSKPAIVVGCCPWLVHHPDRLIDRLIRETSMVFFYDQMDDRDPMRDWGFRHAWGVNMSMPAQSMRDVGGWAEFPHAEGYSDAELAFRLQERFAMPVLYRPRALAPHDHRYEPQAYLDRERTLGRSAWHFAKQRPEFAKALFGRDLALQDEVEYSRQFVARERAAAERLRETFLTYSTLPATFFDSMGVIGDTADQQFEPVDALVATPTTPADGTKADAAQPPGPTSGAAAARSHGITYGAPPVSSQRVAQNYPRAASGGESNYGRPSSRVMIRMAYEQHLLLKRWIWRTGLLDAVES
jgi:GT2 family glycosyltransferase